MTDSADDAPKPGTPATSDESGVERSKVESAVAPSAATSTSSTSSAGEPSGPATISAPNASNASAPNAGSSPSGTSKNASSNDETIQAVPARQSNPRSLNAEPDFGPRYRVVEMLGKGGMGEVYRAYDVELKGEVALKIVRADGDTEEALARFRREIALARRVTSPNVLRVYDLADFRGLRFLSMEFVEGEDLSILLKREKRLPTDRALSIFRQVALGLSAAHALGVVHRDLKPQNVLIDREGNARIADFGLARSMGESGMTASGAVLGSPAYMSPEQVTGDPTDARSDIYSLGIMLYQLASGQTPFQAPTANGVMSMRLHKKPPPIREIDPSVPASIERVIEKCLQLEVSARYSSIQELLADLDSANAPTIKPPPASTRSPASARPPAAVPPAPPSAAPPPAANAASKTKTAAMAAALGVVGLAALGYGLFGGKPGVGQMDAGTNEGGAANALVAPFTAGEGGAAAAGGPVTALVFGFDNHTVDSEFDGTLEILVRSSLRRSTYVNPIAGSELRRLGSEVTPDVPLDDKLGAAVATRDHRRVLNVHGKIDPKGAAFSLTLAVTDATTGQMVVNKTIDAPSLDRVVPTVALLSSAVRTALGETVSTDESEKTGLSPSLAADHQFALGFAAEENGNYSGAADAYKQAIVKDPSFCFAHARRAIALTNLEREDETNHELQAALPTIDQLGERDRLKVLGDYYELSTEQYNRAIASYDELLSKWPNDEAAETNLAAAYQARGDAAKALELTRQASSEHPKDLVLLGNTAELEIYASEFDRAVIDSRKMLTELPRPTNGMYAYLAIALTVLGRRDEAQQAMIPYRKADASNALQLDADVAMSEGRLRDADALLQSGIADDQNEKNPDGVEVKESMLAELRARRGDKAGTHAAAALVTKQPARRFTAALALLAIHDTRGAKSISTQLAGELAPSRRVMAQMIEAESLRVSGKPRDAMIAFQDAMKLEDLPISHFLFARAALDAKDYTTAYSELTYCLSHRGPFANASDEITAIRYIPQFTFHLAQAQEGLASAQATATYQSFLAMMHDPDPEDPFVVEARKHVAAK